MGNIWTDLKDKNNLYRNLILLKSYLLSDGHINKNNECENRQIKNSLKELLGDDFDINFYNNNVSFLLSQKIVNYHNYLSLSTYGLEYVERLIDDLNSLTEEDVEEIRKNNNGKLIKFLEVSSKIGTTISPLINLINILKNN